MSEHMRIEAGQGVAKEKRFTVTLDGVDVSNVATLADDEAGEVWLSAHKIRDDGSVEILYSSDLLPLVMRSWRVRTTDNPNGDRVWPSPPVPHFVCRGVVTITEKQDTHAAQCGVGME